MHRQARSGAVAKKPLIECIRRTEENVSKGGLAPGVKTGIAAVAVVGIALLGNQPNSSKNSAAARRPGRQQAGSALGGGNPQMPPLLRSGTPTMPMIIDKGWDLQQCVVYEGPFKVSRLETVVNAVPQIGRRMLIFFELLNGYTSKGFWVQVAVGRNYVVPWTRGIFFMKVEVFNRHAKSINGDDGADIPFNGPVFDMDDIRLSMHLRDGKAYTKAVDLDTHAAAVYSTPAAGTYFVGDYSKEHSTKGTGFRFTGLMDEAYCLSTPSRIFESPVRYKTYGLQFAAHMREDYLPVTVEWNAWHTDANLNAIIRDGVELPMAKPIINNTFSFMGSDIAITRFSGGIVIGSGP